MPHTQRQQDYLQAMGISLWHLKHVPEDDYLIESSNENETPAQSFLEPVSVSKLESIQSDSSVLLNEVSHVEVKSKEADTSGQGKIVANATHDVEITATPHSANNKKISESVKPERVEEKPLSESSENSNVLQSNFIADIMHCQACASRTSRLHVLSGQGNEKASVFYLSDAPNDDENYAGHYLVDKCAQLFQAMLETIGIEQDFFYTGLVKCHSLQDFVVSEEDVQLCAGYLQQQISYVDPKIIVLQGINSARALLKTTQTFNQLRGQVHRLSINNKVYPAIVTFHPAYLIRNPLYKREALSDLIRIKQLLND